MMRRPRADETKRAASAPQYMATMIAAAFFGLSRIIEMPPDLAHLGLYAMFVGCAAMMLPAREMWCTVYGPIGVLLAVTLFCVLAITVRPTPFAGVTGVLGFMLLIASAITAYAVLVCAGRFLLRSELVSTEVTGE